MVDTFTKGQTEATKNQSALTARAIDTIDRNTEVFGEVKALLRETSSHLRAVPVSAQKKPKPPSDSDT